MTRENATDYVDYIDEEFRRRKDGLWFYNNGVPTYITGSHYMFLQWSKIDVGYPDYRDANRTFFIFGKRVKKTRTHTVCVFLKTDVVVFHTWQVVK